MIQMMQGHALTILSEMPRDCLFDAVITDPPYASGAATLSGISAKTSTKYTSSKRGNCPYPDFEGDAMDKRSWANLMLQVLLEARMRTKPGGVIAMFVDWRQTPVASDVMQWAGWTWRGMAQWDTRYYQGGRCATPGFFQDVCAANFEMDSLRMHSVF